MISLRKYTGKGQYKDLCWWVYKLEEPLFGYTHVYCMPYAITDEMMAIAAEGKTKRDATTPDIDKRGTGNIHPSLNDLKAAMEDPQIRQLVLNVWHDDIRQYGPALKEGMVCDGSVYHNFKADVPVANYYPMITPIKELTKEEKKKQDVLSQISSALPQRSNGMAAAGGMHLPK